MYAKLSIVEEEADECVYWLELIVAANVVGSDRVAPLEREAREILAMTIASKKTLAARMTRGRA